MNLLATIIPIPIPVHHLSHGGGDPKVYLALLITLNVIIVSVFLIKTIIYFLSKPKYTTFVEYAIWSDTDSIITDVNTMFFAVTNGIALIILLTYYIYTAL